MADGVAARYLLPGFRLRPSTLKRIAAIGIDLPIRGHGGLPSKLGSFRRFDPTAAEAVGNGCVFSHRARAAGLDRYQSDSTTRLHRRSDAPRGDVRGKEEP